MIASGTVRCVFGAGHACDLSTAPPAMSDLDRVPGGPVRKHLANATAVQDFDELEPVPFGRLVGPSAPTAHDASDDVRRLVACARRSI
jgi:hypothetical protein